MSCRPTVAECHKTLPFKVETDSAAINSPPLPSITCVDAVYFQPSPLMPCFVCDLSLVYKPHADLRGLIIGLRRGGRRPYSTSSIYWTAAHVVVIIFPSVDGRNTHSLKAFWDNGYYSRPYGGQDGGMHRRAKPHKQTEHKLITKTSSALTPALQTQLQGIERFQHHRILPQPHSSSLTL